MLDWLNSEWALVLVIWFQSGVLVYTSYTLIRSSRYIDQLSKALHDSSGLLEDATRMIRMQRHQVQALTDLLRKKEGRDA